MRARERARGGEGTGDRVRVTTHKTPLLHLPYLA